MRQLIVTQNITIDGVIDAREGWFAVASDPTVDQSDLVAAMTEQREAADAFLTGRVTFEQMRGYWPDAEDDSGTSDYLNRVHKYVVSSTLEDPGWEPATVLPDLDAVADLKAADGADIVCTGSVRLSRALVAAGLVDEYRLYVYPVVLGRGTRLFEDATGVGALDRVDALPFRGGVTLLTYRPR